MASVQDIRMLVEAIRVAETATERASVKALAQVTLQAEADAKKNATVQFTGRHGYTLSGMMLNSIYSGFAKEDDGLAGFVGVRNIPYGAIHEYGDTVTPVNAKALWVKNHRAGPQFKRMTPREFMAAMEGDRRRFGIWPSKSGNMIAWNKPQAGAKAPLPLFYLVDSVTIPARPYVTPAVGKAFDAFPLAFARFYASELAP